MSGRYRKGVGAIVFNAQGLVLVGRRTDVPGGAWQPPQGGLDKGEAPRAALLRELAEEIGTANAAIIAAIPGWLAYDVPADLARSAWGGKYVGQKQRWFALRFLGDDAEIDVGAAAHPEFDAWRWVELAALPALAVSFKQALYERIVAAFAHLAAAAPARCAPPHCALVTGAGRRIGRAIALDLAAAGWAVAVHHHHSAAAARETCAAISEAGGRAVPVCADLAREEETTALVEAAERVLAAPLTCLVNNASVFERDDALTATRASWDRHMEVNLRAPLVLSQELVRRLPAGTQANIINILDQRVWRLTPYFTSYTVSKMGLWTLTRTLAMALAPMVRVNAIGPGPTLPSVRQSAAQFARQWQAVPLRRAVDPAEIGAAVRFILDAPSLTGQMIAIDAGQHLGWGGGGGGGEPPDE